MADVYTVAAVGLVPVVLEAEFLAAAVACEGEEVVLLAAPAVRARVHQLRKLHFLLFFLRFVVD